MDIIVEDTNILIDLCKMGLIEHCHRLEVAFHTTRHVLSEITDPEQIGLIMPLIDNGLLFLDGFEGEDYSLLRRVSAEYQIVSNLTETDCSVMLLAERYNCRLLTSDQKLKSHALKRGLTVNGLLWLTDSLVEAGIVTADEMIVCLKRYLASNIRAPKPEIDKRINQYKQG